MKCGTRFLEIIIDVLAVREDVLRELRVVEVPVHALRAREKRREHDRALRAVVRLAWPPAARLFRITRIIGEPVQSLPSDRR